MYDILPLDHGQWGAYAGYALMTAPNDLIDRTMTRVYSEAPILSPECQQLCESVSESAARQYVGSVAIHLRDSFLQGIETGYALVEESGAYDRVRMADAQIVSHENKHMRHDQLQIMAWWMYRSDPTVAHTIDACMAGIVRQPPHEHMIRSGIATGLMMVEHGQRNYLAQLEADVKILEAETIVREAYRNLRRDGEGV